MKCWQLIGIDTQSPCGLRLFSTVVITLNVNLLVAIIADHRSSSPAFVFVARGDKCNLYHTGQDSTLSVKIHTQVCIFMRRSKDDDEEE